MGQHKDLMEQWFQRVWNENDTNYIYEVCAPEMKTKGHRGRDILGPDDFIGFHGIICSLVDDIQMDIIHCVEDGDWVSVVYNFEGKKKNTDIDVKMTGSTMIRFENGKAVDVHEHVDFLKLFEALGVLPENALEMGLSGVSKIA